VNGFLGGEWNEYQGYVAVRAGDAHSWDEVFYPGSFRNGPGGTWVTVDATPSGDVDVLGRGGAGWRARMSRFFDTLRFQWTKWVIEYDLVSQLSLFKSLGGALKSAGRGIKIGVVWLKDQAVDHWPIASALGIGLIAVGLTRRRRRLAKLPPAARPLKPRVRSTVAEVYDGVAKQLAKAGFPRPASDTPRELATRMTAQGAPAATPVRELTDLYYAAEWGARRDPGAEDRAAALAREIRQTLTEHRRAKPLPR
ncbi:MAG: DUF4129 domain-containing protein, partial [Kofleriaceae bacterium]